MKKLILAIAALLVMETTDANGKRLEPGQPRHCPSAWCGCWLQSYLGIPAHRKDLWRARNWARFGKRLPAPRVGAIVVWRHHVGIIVGRSKSGWIVKSGNDGNRVRSRVRSLSKVIAYRSAH